MKEIIKKCNSYDKQVGCYHTFDGKCNKENCQMYNLLKENEELKKQYNDIYDYLQEREKLINGTIQDIYKANQKLEKIKTFLNFEFSGKNQWVKDRLLQIIEEK